MLQNFQATVNETQQSLRQRKRSNSKQSLSAHKSPTVQRADQMEMIHANASERIPNRKRPMNPVQNADMNVVKIYHELTDDFGNMLRDSKTFNLKDSQAADNLLQ